MIRTIKIFFNSLNYAYSNIRIPTSSDALAFKGEKKNLLALIRVYLFLPFSRFKPNLYLFTFINLVIFTGNKSNVIE